jgi:hypothetical protein
MLSSSFWPKNKLLKQNTQPTPLILLQMASSRFQNIKFALKRKIFQDIETFE